MYEEGKPGRGLKSHRELAAQLNWCPVLVWFFFCHFSKGYSAIPTPGNLNIEIIRGLQGVTKPNARDEFQHMPPVFSFPSAFWWDVDVSNDREHRCGGHSVNKLNVLRVYDVGHGSNRNIREIAVQQRWNSKRKYCICVFILRALFFPLSFILFLPLCFPAFLH